MMLLGVAKLGATEENRLKSYLEYRTFPRITKTVYPMADSVAKLCRDPRSDHGLHLKAGLHLYANPSALKGFRSDSKGVHYSVGAVWVKEKYEKMNDFNPSIITVMEKVTDRGSVDDWVFTLIRLSDKTEVTERGTVSCLDCHKKFPENDFVSPFTVKMMQDFLSEESKRNGPTRSLKTEKR